MPTDEEYSSRDLLVDTISRLRYNPKQIINRSRLPEITNNLSERVMKGEIIDFIIVPFIETNPSGGTTCSFYSVFVKEDND